MWDLDLVLLKDILCSTHLFRLASVFCVFIHPRRSRSISRGRIKKFLKFGLAYVVRRVLFIFLFSSFKGHCEFGFGAGWIGFGWAFGTGLVFGSGLGFPLSLVCCMDGRSWVGGWMCCVAVCN